MGQLGGFQLALQHPDPILVRQNLAAARGYQRIAQFLAKDMRDIRLSILSLEPIGYIPPQKLRHNISGNSLQRQMLFNLNQSASTKPGAIQLFAE